MATDPQADQSSVRCPDCGWVVDTPAHELGCQPDGHRNRRDREEFLRLFDALIDFGETHMFRGRRRVLVTLKQVRRQRSLTE